MGFPERNCCLEGPGEPGARCGKRWSPSFENSLTSTPVSGEPAWVWWTLAVFAAILAALAVWIWWKGRPFAQGDVFRASRLSAGNHLFPTQVLITDAAVVQYKPRWIGRVEETIHMAHVSSVKIDTRLLLSDVLIETSGGSDPIRCHGHHKRDADQMKKLIERAQSLYYRGAGRPVAPPLSSR
jgi:Bacterial PH domain